MALARRASRSPPRSSRRNGSPEQDREILRARGARSYPGVELTSTSCLPMLPAIMDKQPVYIRRPPVPGQSPNTNADRPAHPGRGRRAHRPCHQRGSLAARCSQSTSRFPPAAARPPSTATTPRRSTAWSAASSRSTSNKPTARCAAWSRTPGSVVHIAGGRAHTVRNESRAAASAYVVFTPGAEIERFFRAAGALAGDDSPRLEDVLALAASHGIEITGPVPG